MRGKIRADNKYNKLRTEMMEAFRPVEKTETPALYLTFKEMTSINHLIYGCCDENENFDWDKRSHARILYKVLRIARRPVLWRELEDLAEVIFNDKYTTARRAVAEAFAILYSVNLVDYKLLKGYTDPGSGLTVEIKGDDDWR